MGTLPKEEFLQLLKALVDKITENAKEILISAFTKCGIVPCCVDKLLERLLEFSQSTSSVEESFILFLSEQRKACVSSNNTNRRKKRTKIKAGQNIFDENSDENQSSELDEPDESPIVPVVQRDPDSSSNEMQPASTPKRSKPATQSERK